MAHPTKRPRMAEMDVDVVACGYEVLAAANDDNKAGSSTGRWLSSGKAEEVANDDKVGASIDDQVADDNVGNEMANWAMMTKLPMTKLPTMTTF